MDSVLLSVTSGIETQLKRMEVEQNSQIVALMRIADTLSEHTARFDEIDRKLSGIEQTLAAILGKLP